MKRIVTSVALSLVLALSLCAPGVLAKGKKTKASPERVAAIKKCNEDYAAAKKEARTKTGKERKEALNAASKSHQDCIKNAPK